MSAVAEALNALRAEAGTYPEAVQIWMRVMAISYFAGIVFSVHNRRALWIVGAAAFTMAGLVAGKLFSPDLSRSTIGAVVHLVLWPAALYLLWRPGHRFYSSGWASRTYLIWAFWVSALMGISLVLDLKALVFG